MIAASKYFHAIDPDIFRLVADIVHDQFVYPLVTLKYFAYPDTTFALRYATVASATAYRYEA